ncbi:MULTISPECIES: hypothetical protein [unclassified Tolypothrix]|uniref:hypothetical protein n=1 Tax=unclassified Tolypothrix TaxID=2649714 RepID=UPI0005EAB2FA|nr:MULTISPECIES: hypothetical protein [unclassified Tolypothrix]EKE96432.1 hypothetical protein FDUTEX481_09778 [Tolypothrix sp. PCC 7601]MBE9084137.1 hypothetical protein [Tolypothrix sp. LEGE 11397]UYD31036.1 hypothetical protein HGR01_40015 [Tolypothrix sp. PCC 7712]BAY96012.1 hypothetical protein NIES3275_80890 [Microchaete diplosiphon NIES-3275]
MHGYIEAADYRKRDSWSVDRIKFEIEEIDKVNSILNQEFNELKEEVDWAYKKTLEYEENRNSEKMTAISKTVEHIPNLMEDLQNKIGQNLEKRKELVKFLRSKL